MLIKRPADITYSEVTPENLYHNRREFLRTASASLGVAAAGMILPGCVNAASSEPAQAKPKGPYDTTEKATPYEDITTYNNYYEFGTDKSDPAVHAKNFKPANPWMVSVEGMVKKPMKWALTDLIKGIAVEDRIYRMRCVEAWSMVIPWNGVPLAEVIKRLEPTPAATHVVFKTILDPKQMPGQQDRFLLNWPYTEGLRMDEAMNPLAMMATGIYGKPLPNQDGAPWRLVTPWKYGFKGAKAIATIIFTDKQPTSAWMQSSPREYGFYANVNPEVDHPRWSQKSERRIGEFFRRPTLPFNGYTDQVAKLYAGMDLRKNF
jgi:methionine sulfoxide reductase catalytic subunit